MEFSEIYSHYDREEEKNLIFRRKLEKEISSKHLIFYEKYKTILKIDSLTFSVIYGVILFSLHLLSTLLYESVNEYSIILDYSFLLSFMNAIGLFLLFNATEKLRSFVVNLIQLTKLEKNKASNNFLSYYKKHFLGNQSLYFGITFGLINTLFAFLFGVAYSSDKIFILATFYIQVFSIGFIGGITINATLIIIKLIDKISIEEDINLTYFYPDKCAGTLIIGNILFTFSIYFIIIGVVIFLFIHNYDWVNAKSDNINHYLLALIEFWKIFPFILSGIIFFLPVKKLNMILKEYKFIEQLKVRKRMHYITGLILGLESDQQKSKDKINILDNHYQKLAKIDEQIGNLNTWPYNLSYRTTFLSIFLPVVIGIILEISKQLISGLFK